MKISRLQRHRNKTLAQLREYLIDQGAPPGTAVYHGWAGWSWAGESEGALKAALGLAEESSRKEISDALESKFIELGGFLVTFGAFMEAMAHPEKVWAAVNENVSPDSVIRVQGWKQDKEAGWFWVTDRAADAITTETPYYWPHTIWRDLARPEAQEESKKRGKP